MGEERSIHPSASNRLKNEKFEKSTCAHFPDVHTVRIQMRIQIQVALKLFKNYFIVIEMVKRNCFEMCMDGIHRSSTDSSC